MSRRAGNSAEFWDAAARDNAAWYIATAYTSENPEFFAQGAQETDELLRYCGVQVDRDDTVLEIGCGVGRMTRRLAELAGHVIATDVSEEMLAGARRNLADRPNVELVRVPGDGRLPGEDASVDLVFSYITLQHVPTAEAQLRYLREAIRVLRPGGHAAIQLRSPGFATRAQEWIAHVGHLLQGRRTLSRAWRGSRLPLSTLYALATPQLPVRVERPNRHHIWFVAG